MGLEESHISERECIKLFGRTIDERYHYRTMFIWKKEKGQFSMARELNDFIHEAGKQIRQKCMRLRKWKAYVKL